MCKNHNNDDTNISMAKNSIKKVSPLTCTKKCSPSLQVLSVIWFALCTSLVWKHHELVGVFGAFLASWFLAGSAQVLSATSTRTLVGMSSCVAELVALSRQHDPIDAPIQALRIASGYLAFDHWFSAWFYIPKSMWRIFEDAGTLTIFLVILVLDASSSSSSSVSSRFGNIFDDNTFVTNFTWSWTIYKTIHTLKTALEIYRNKQNHPSQQKEAASVIHKQGIRKGHMDSSHLWRIYGQAYDLSDYVNIHPGGKEAILLGRGRPDCTALFESYHPFSKSQVQMILQKYRVQDAPKNKTIDLQKDPFYEILCNRVSQTLQEQQFSPIHDRAATWQRTMYYMIIVCAVVSSGIYHCRGSVLGSFCLAVFGWFIGSLGHDAGHFAVSRRPWVNDVAVWGMSFLCNPIVWQHQHTFAHHSHTNDYEKDPDLHHFVTFLRVHQRFQQSQRYRFQSNGLFVLFSYLFVVFGTCFWIPWGVISDGSLYGMVEWTDRNRRLRTVGMFIHLFTYTALMMILPFFVHSSWIWALVAIVVHVGTSGLIFAIFSQINHLNEPSLDPIAFQKRRQQNTHVDFRLEESWAVAQIETSNNFCPKSALWHFLSNGLNLQIEHHLFPGLNHCHLHRIQPVVQEVCQEYGVCYKSYNSWQDLMQATLEWLERLSIEPEQVKCD